MIFMGGYGIFLASIAGMLIADYWIVKEQKINIPASYDPDG
jgi:NCS1 family nucleobase:cation symporter-1